MCTEVNKNKIIVLRDSGNGKCQMIFNNPNAFQITKIRIDGCTITQGSKCDFKLDCENIEHYIEIKGKDIFYACEQIEGTINKVSSDPKNCPKYSFVVSTGSPNIGGKIQILKKKFKKEYNSKLTIQTNRCVHTL